MKIKKATYTDPTGGGDDIVLTVPEWAEFPQYLTVRGVEDRERYEFDLDEESLDEDEED